MKILHVNKFFDPHRGAEMYLHALMRHQEAAGHEVHAFSTRSPKNLTSKDAARFVTRYDLSRSDGIATDIRKAMNFLWNTEAKQSIEQALDELRPDVVHLHNSYHHLSSSILEPIRASKIPCVHTLHDLKLACPNYRMYTEGSPCSRCKGGHYYQATLHRCILSSLPLSMLASVEMYFTKGTQAYERTVKTFLCPSDFMARTMIEWGEPASKFRVIRFPIIRRQRALRGGGYLLVVGELSPEKGIGELLKAAQQVPEIRIKIAGRGPLEEQLRKMVVDDRITNVEFVGYKRDQELTDLYTHAEAFIACPIGYENAPLTVMDALGYGLPLLVTNFGGLPEMVDDGKSGFLVERASVTAWAEALRRFMALSEIERSRMAEQSYTFGREQFPTWEEHLKMLEECY